MYEKMIRENLFLYVTRWFINVILVEHEYDIWLTCPLVKWSIAIGQIRPAIVPIPLDIPIKILAYLGAISRWLTLYPEIANPLNATPKVNAPTATVY